LQGKVLQEDGTPAAGIRVLAGGERSQSHQMAVTDANGVYTVHGLGTGTHRVMIIGQREDKVIAPLEAIMVKDGQPNIAPDMKFVKGALVEGVVTDAETGAPLAKATFGTNNGMSQATSDDKGQYSMRVVPGKVQLYVFSFPEGYLPPDDTQGGRAQSFEVASGDTRKIDWKLTKGLDLAGEVRDEEGKAVPNITLSMREQSKEWRERQELKSDEKGHFSIKGLKKKTYEFVARDEWEVIKPKQVTLPMGANVPIVVRKVPMLALSGRVLTPDGKPVEKAQIAFSIMIPDGGNSWTSRESKVLSDATGTFSLDKLRGEYQVRLTASLDGYKPLKGGEAKFEAGKWSVQDVIMQPLTGRVAGRVLDSAGQPASGIKVMSPGGGSGSRAVSDAQGQFSLMHLPDGEVTVVAVGTAGAIATPVRAGSTNATLSLKPVRPVTAPDVEMARGLLEDVWETSRGSNWWRRTRLPSLIVQHDFDYAWQLAGGGDAKKPVDDNVVLALIERLCDVNPETAIDWAPDQLAGIKNAHMRFTATVAVALAAVPLKPELAAQLYEQAQKIEIEGGRSANRLASLAAVAARLKRPEAAKLADEALAGVKTDNENFHELEQVATQLAQGSVELAEKALAKIPATVEEYRRFSPYRPVIEKLSQYDVAGAERVWEKFNTVAVNQSYYPAQAVRPLARAIAKTDSAKALALARRVDGVYAAEALTEVAQVLPKEQALPVLREAMQKASSDRWSGVERLCKIALLLRPLDAAASAEAVQLARQILEERLTTGHQDEYWRNQQAGRDMAWIALALRYTDPAAARMMLEEEWAFQKALPLDTNRYGNSQVGLAVAMTALDPARALDMSWQVTDQNNNSLDVQFEAQRKIAQFLFDPNQVDDGLLERY
jgi:hypothetical protein